VALIPEVESLLAQLQRNHIQHVRVEIDPAVTLMDLSRVEYAGGEKEAGRKEPFFTRALPLMGHAGDSVG
jgi:hypothetical protein